MKSFILKSITIAFIFSVFLMPSHAQELELFMTVNKEDLNDEDQAIVAAQANACIGSDELTPSPEKKSFDVEKVVLLGEKIWKIIEDGKPTLAVEEKSWSVLPLGAEDWTNLELWQEEPFTQAYSVKMLNKLGMEVVSLRYVIIGNYGGSANGVGSYLANVSVIPTHIEVSWGFDLSVELEALNPINIGKKSDPVAALPFQIKYTISTVVKKIMLSNGYQVSGKGRIQTIQ